ncbi:hypothetical protein AC1031_000892 [Aphanomyces cochlioides]|nr:hypothetical protein AC1031_000892 [Aphanomyces cochlioides]
MTCCVDFRGWLKTDHVDSQTGFCTGKIIIKFRVEKIVGQPCRLVHGRFQLGGFLHMQGWSHCVRRGWTGDLLQVFQLEIPNSTHVLPRYNAIEDPLVILQR